MTINDLLKKNKYQNPENLFRIEYELHNITTNNEATVVFIYIQSKLNLFALDEISLKYVFNISEKIILNKKKYELERQYLLDNFKINTELLNININQLLKKLKTFTKNGFGYQTYGDYEHWYGSYASVIMNYASFVEFTTSIKVDLENINERVGLSNIWIEKMKKSYDKIESLLIINEKRT